MCASLSCCCVEKFMPPAHSFGFGSSFGLSHGFPSFNPCCCLPRHSSLVPFVPLTPSPIPLPAVSPFFPIGF